MASYTNLCPRTGSADLTLDRTGVGAVLDKAGTTFPYVGNDVPIYQVTAYFKANDSITANLTCQIFENDGTEPSSPTSLGVLATVVASLTTEWQEITFYNAVPIDSGLEGLIVLFKSDSSDDSILIANNGGCSSDDPCGQVYYTTSFANWKNDIVPITVWYNSPPAPPSTGATRLPPPPLIARF